MDTPAKDILQLNWINRFAQLGETFYTRLQPTPLPQVHWVGCNDELAKSIGLPQNWSTIPGVLEAFSGCSVLDGSEPLASVYSGHQFGVWAGQLGDGRAVYLGELQTDLGGLEIQLKGAGQTPYSRSGDGRAVLRSSIREYLCSEAMHALGIPTTRALCISGSRGLVYREEVERAAVVTRLSPSFIRFGHFEHFAAKGDVQNLGKLADFVIAQYSSLLFDNEEFELLGSADTSEPLNQANPLVKEELRQRITQNPYALMLYRITRKTAKLIAHWQSVGFCHGVMNTDNMSILGLTLDYGPFQFMDAYDPDHICNHSDHQGRYAFDQQPNVAYWNLYCLGQALLPLIQDSDLAVACLDHFKTAYPRFKQEMMLAKLGLPFKEEFASMDGIDLVKQLERVMQIQQVDFTVFWRTLSNDFSTYNDEPKNLINLEALLTNPLAQKAWREWLPHFVRAVKSSGRDVVQISQSMLRANPKYVLRNHLGEEAIKSAEKGDFTQVEILLKILKSPFDEQTQFESYADIPPAWASSISISCSS